MMEERLSYMVTQIGSLDKVIKYYKKNTEEEFRSYFFDILKENKLSEMQKKIVEEVEITLRKFVIFSNQYQKDLPFWCRNGRWRK
jgi:peptidyl-prolyl cis-trans isomerase SurA